MSSLQTVPDESAFNNLVSSAAPSALLVLYFQASWAAPCTQMSVILNTLASTYPNDPSAIQFLSIDAEALPDASESYDVASVPFIVLQKGGKTVDTISGSDATKVRNTIEKHAGSPSSSSNSKSIPAPLSADPSAAPQATKDLSSYAPKPTDPKTAPEFSTTAPSKEELFARLANLVKAAPVMLFMKGTPSAPQCGFSRQLVSILRENGVKYGFFNILADDDVRQGLKEYADWPTFPQLWTNGELIGGLDIVREEIANDPEFLKPFSVNKDTAAAA